MSVRGRFKLGAALALVAVAAAVPLIFGSVGNAGFAVPANKVLQDPFADGLGYHGSAEEPSILAARNPSTAVHPGSNPNKSTIIATEQVGRVYDGGASDIGYEVSVNGGDTWKNGELPITIQGGQANTCGGPVNRASDTVTAYNEKYDQWLISTLGLSNGANVPAVYINIGKVRFTDSDPTTFMGGPAAGVGDVAWSPPICQHITQPWRVAGQELDHLRQLEEQQGLRLLLRRVGQQRQRQPRDRSVLAGRRSDVVRAADDEHERQLAAGQRQHRRCLR